MSQRQVTHRGVEQQLKLYVRGSSLASSSSLGPPASPLRATESRVDGYVLNNQPIKLEWRTRALPQTRPFDYHQQQQEQRRRRRQQIKQQYSNKPRYDRPHRVTQEADCLAPGQRRDRSRSFHRSPIRQAGATGVRVGWIGSTSSQNTYSHPSSSRKTPERQLPGELSNLRQRVTEHDARPTGYGQKHGQHPSSLEPSPHCLGHGEDSPAHTPPQRVCTRLHLSPSPSTSSSLSVSPQTKHITRYWDFSSTGTELFSPDCRSGSRDTSGRFRPMMPVPSPGSVPSSMRCVNGPTLSSTSETALSSPSNPRSPPQLVRSSTTDRLALLMIAEADKKGQGNENMHGGVGGTGRGDETANLQTVREAKETKDENDILSQTSESLYQGTLRLSLSSGESFASVDTFAREDGPAGSENDSISEHESGNTGGGGGLEKQKSARATTKTDHLQEVGARIVSSNSSSIRVNHARTLSGHVAGQAQPKTQRHRRRREGHSERRGHTDSLRRTFPEKGVLPAERKRKCRVSHSTSTRHRKTTLKKEMKHKKKVFSGRKKGTSPASEEELVRPSTAPSARKVIDTGLDELRRKGIRIVRRKPTNNGGDTTEGAQQILEKQRLRRLRDVNLGEMQDRARKRVDAWRRYVSMWFLWSK